MKGSEKVIEALNDVLTAELTAVNQYWIHARMCENWGFERLWKKIRAEAIDEMRHADELVARVLYLDGHPNMQRLGKINIGENVLEQMQLDLSLEKDAIARLNSAVELSVAEGDNGSRELFEKMLVSEEEHADWLEAQVDLIERVGLQNYLTQQIRE